MLARRDDRDPAFRGSNRSRAVHLQRAAPLLLTLLLATSCSTVQSGSAETTSTGEQSVGASFSLQGDADEAALDRGKQKARGGEYGDAAAAYTRVYENVSAKPEYRAEALFELGQVFTNILNPERNEDRAAGYFRKLIDEYPESALRPRAEQRLRDLEPPE